jgi:hypothetical protein
MQFHLECERKGLQHCQLPVRQSSLSCVCCSVGIILRRTFRSREGLLVAASSGSACPYSVAVLTNAKMHLVVSIGHRRDHHVVTLVNVTQVFSSGHKTSVVHLVRKCGEHLWLLYSKSVSLLDGKFPLQIVIHMFLGM